MTRRILCWGMLALSLISSAGCDRRAKANARLTEKLRAQVVERLKDPSSAQFKSETLVKMSSSKDSPVSLCGEVNAKNGFGGYVGFSRFISNDQGLVVFAKDEESFDTVWQTWCSGRPA